MIHRSADDSETLIEHDLPCPNCGYNLRGLPGEIAECPECGRRWDAALLLANRWKGHWQDVPGIRAMMTPMVWLAVGFIIVGFVMTIETAWVQWPGWPTGSIFVAMLLGWAVALRLLKRSLGSTRAVVLSLHLHALCVCYLLGVIGVTWCIVDLFGQLTALPAVLNLFIAACFITVILLGRRYEQWIAHECIRMKMRQIGRIDGMWLSEESTNIVDESHQKGNEPR